jgi:hypothetical protein
MNHNYSITRTQVHKAMNQSRSPLTVDDLRDFVKKTGHLAGTKYVQDGAGNNIKELVIMISEVEYPKDRPLETEGVT